MRALLLTSMHNTNGQPLASYSKVIFLPMRAFAVAAVLFLVLTVPLQNPSSGQAPAKPQVQADETSRKTNDASESPPTANPNVTETLVDETLADDPDILKMLEPYRARVRELDTVIGRLKGELRKTRIGAGTLGNFVTDGLRAEASRKLGKPITVMVTNSGGMRKNSIAEGELRVRDIFELLPFENKLITVDMSGTQLLRLLAIVLTEQDAQSGARITYRLTAGEKPEFVSAKLINTQGREQAIDPKAIYRVATIDYLYNLKSGNYSILQEARNLEPIGITMRDALMNYVKTENANERPIRATMDNRFTQIGPSAKEAAQE